MFLKTSFTTLIVGVFVVYVLHTCWVMYGIVYTKPCDSPKGDNCITPFLAGNPKLQVSDVIMFSVQLSVWVVWFNRQGRNLIIIIIIISLCVDIQLSIYTALRPNAEGGHTLIHKEENFDVNSKFERLVEIIINLENELSLSSDLINQILIYSLSISKNTFLPSFSLFPPG